MELHSERCGSGRPSLRASHSATATLSAQAVKAAALKTVHASRMVLSMTQQPLPDAPISEGTKAHDRTRLGDLSGERKAKEEAGRPKLPGARASSEPIAVARADEIHTLV